jgi:hypothetical protein
MANDPDESFNLPPGVEDDLTEEQIEYYIQKFEELQRDFEQIQLENAPKLEAWVRNLAGEKLDQFLSSEQETLNAFSDPDPKIRHVAVHLAINHWKLKSSIADLYEKIGINDSDSGVRSSAIGAIGFVYVGSRNERIGHLLASFVQDETLTESARCRAYRALIQVHGPRGLQPGRIPSSAYHLKDIEWAFVTNFRSEEYGGDLKSN